MSFPNVADLSSAQRNPDGSGFDAAAHAASGRVAVIIKSTEGTGYHFSGGDAWEYQALANQLVVGRYHWAGSSTSSVLGDPDTEGDFFLKYNGDHTPGRFAAVDFENPSRGSPLYGLSPAAAAQWCGAFLDHIGAQGGWPGMGYSMSGSDVIQRLKAPYLRWYAGYPTLVGVSGEIDLHQFTDNGPVPGVGHCDDSYCYIDLRAFAGSSVPTVSSTFHPSGGQEDSHMSVTAGPDKTRVDAVVVSIPEPGRTDYPAGSGPVWHAFGSSVDALLAAGWEDLGGMAYAVSAAWTVDPPIYVVSAHGVDGHLWVKTWDAANQWSAWRQQKTGIVL